MSPPCVGGGRGLGHLLPEDAPADAAAPAQGAPTQATQEERNSDSIIDALDESTVAFIEAIEASEKAGIELEDDNNPAAAAAANDNEDDDDDSDSD